MQHLNGHARASVAAPAPAQETLSPAPAVLGSQQTQDSSKALAPTRWTAAIEEAIARRDAINSAMQQLMREGTDYGKIPGTERPTLLQPGAEKLCVIFGIRIKYEVEVAIEDFTGENYGATPFFYYRIRGTATHNGEFLGEGLGSCHLWESRYKWRKGERTCPACGQAAIIKGREEYGGGWLCFARKGGCGAKFAAGDEKITGQVVGRVINPDLLDGVNTVLKIAIKRAKIASTINATGASEFFTQDLEDTQEQEDVSPRPAPAPQPQPQPQPAPPLRPAAVQQPGATPTQNPWVNKGAMKAAFHEQRKRTGDLTYLQILRHYNVQDPGEFRRTEDAIEAYGRLCAAPTREVA